MLPVLQLENQIAAHLAQHNRLVLTAPTGSGKTTQVPQILLRHSATDGRILVLQPRRLAARLVARRVAWELKAPLGGLVGYQTRHDSQVSEATRILFLTEGLFLRLLQSSPRLDGAQAVVLDEFHERSLAADLSLGLVRLLQEKGRPDLRLIAMSATLDVEQVSAYLGCSVVQVHGRAHPVEVLYRPGSAQDPSWERAAQALRELLHRGAQGDVLVFMPGAYEIRRTIEAAQERLARFPEPLAFFPLHSSLSAAQQDQAVSPCPRRKIIVATNVAETSITIEGVCHVIDSGLARVHRHDPRRGIDALLVESISQASAEQRAGRAGRTAPGTCVRLWSPSEQQARPERDLPEIRRLDLAEAMLQLRFLGVEDLEHFPWLDRPDPPSLERASALLRRLGALDAENRLTALGQRMAQLPAHPRLSRFLAEAAQRKCLERAALWAALIGEREILLQPLHERHTHPADGDVPSDLVVRERAVQRARDLRFDPSACAAEGIRANAAREVEQTAHLYRDACRGAGLQARGKGRTQDLLKCLLVAFFDRVALRRDPHNLLCAMAGQRRVELDSRSAARQGQALIALEVRELEARGDQTVRTVLSLASAIELDWLEELHPERMAVQVETRWNEAEKAVEQVRTYACDGLVYRREVLPQVNEAAAGEILVEQIASGNLKLEQWDREVEQWIWRTRLLARLFPERGLIRYQEDEIRVILHEIVSGATRYSHLRGRACLPHVQNALSWNDRHFVEQMAPAQLRLPSGARLKIEYSDHGPPRGRAKIQDLYDLKETPAIAGGRQKLLLEILGPNFRPVQVTDDLENFWKNTYSELKKELKRRYPKHEWR
jgi:ATP-dependent helicase HrpB